MSILAVGKRLDLPSRSVLRALASSWPALLLLSACRTAPAPTADASPPGIAQAPQAPSTLPPAWARRPCITSNAGTYLVHVEPAPEELPDNEPFELRVWIARAAAPHELARDVALAVDAAMPEHGHGMNRTPRITRAEGGEFLVQGMLLHMTGRWELYFDVTDGALTERAQAGIELE